mmetsp:Transcript_47017/g.114725  ORF Transcript_47017/g.114725 Transcript_47017/m.114725 type:complete len:80 (+) Transcript_47017:1473-1712(+)
MNLQRSTSTTSKEVKTKICGRTLHKSQGLNRKKCYQSGRKIQSCFFFTSTIYSEYETKYTQDVKRLDMPITNTIMISKL